MKSWYAPLDANGPLPLVMVNVRRVLVKLTGAAGGEGLLVWPPAWVCMLKVVWLKNPARTKG